MQEVQEIHREDPTATIAIIHRYDEEVNRGVEIDLVTYLKRRFSLITAEQYNRRFDYEAEKKPVFFTDVFSIKGLEFDHVFVIHFDRYHYPLKKRIDELKKYTNDHFSESFEKDEEKIRNDEKKLLYVAITRAKHSVKIMYNASIPQRISQFVRDFRVEDYEAIGFDKEKYRMKN